MELSQGEPVVAPSAPLEGGQQGTSATVGTPDLTQFMDIPPAPASAEPPVQGAVQGQDDSLRNIQSIADKRQAEIYKLQQTNELLMRQVLEAQKPVQAQGNPYDPNTNWPEWMRYETQQATRQAAEGARQATQEQNQIFMQNLAENAWVNQHPGVDVADIKAFNRQNGIAEWNLDAGYKLLTMPNVMSGIAQAAQGQVMEQFRKPQTGAIPVRGSSTGIQAEPKWNFAKLLVAVNGNPAILDALPPNVRSDFEKELYARQGRT
jgi:hypothetical protein